MPLNSGVEMDDACGSQAGFSKANLSLRVAETEGQNCPCTSARVCHLMEILW